MSMLAALARRWNYSVENPGLGRLLYREGNREYTFPLYEENGALVLVGVPSSQRIHFFFNWHWYPHEFNDEARRRILPRIVAHLHAVTDCVRLFERDAPDTDFAFYPELFAHRDRACEMLDAEGYTWFQEYSSIDILHAEYGVEISGIRTEMDARCVAAVLRCGFPHWHHLNISRHSRGREPGWTVALCMFPNQTCNSWCDED